MTDNRVCFDRCRLVPGHAGGCDIDDTPSLADLLDMIGDAAALLDKAAEHLVTHRHRTVTESGIVELHTIEAFTSQGWAHARQARTVLTDYIATLAPPLTHADTMALVSREAQRFDREETRGLLP